MVAGYDPFRAQADAAAGGIAGSAMGLNDQAGQAMTAAMDPNARSAAWDQVRTNTINSIMPGINSSFAGSGMTGSGLHAQNLASGLSQGLATVENDAYQQGMNRSLAAAGMVPGLNQSMYGANDFLRGVGVDRQGYNQDVINSNILRDQQAQAAPMQALQDYMALVTGAGSQFGVQSSTSKQGGGILGALGLGLQAAPLLFSDKRLKQDIKKVGKLDNGLDVYSYSYKFGGPKHIGLLAQDVEKVKPEAVGEIAGYKAVNYGEAVR
jgi:hypothetical protein